MRWIIRGVAVIAVLIVLAVGVLVAVPAERVAALVTERLSEATGRAVSISGDVRPTLFPSLGIQAEGLTVGNPEWVAAGPLLAAERLHVSVVWSALLRGEIRLDRAEIFAPDITLMRAADGQESWSFEAAPEPEVSAEDPANDADDPTAFAVGFDRAAISGGRLRWIDATSGMDLQIEEIDAVLSLPGTTGPASLEISAATGGTGLSLVAALDGIGPFLDGQVRAITADLNWDGGRIVFDGRAALAPALEGALEVEATDLSPLLSIAGQSMPDLPAGLGRDGIAAAGQVTLTDTGSAHLRDGSLSLDANVLAVELDVLPGPERPQLRGAVSGGTLLLAGLTGAGDGEGQPTAPGATSDGWSRDPIDVSALFAADAELAIRFAGVDFGTAQIGAVEMNTTVESGRLVFDIGRIEAYGGRLAGQAVVNGRGGLSLGSDLILAGVQLGPLLQQFASFDRLEGTGNASLQVLGVGNDLASIMGSLEGQGDMSFGAGAILGLDIAGMIRSLDTSFQGEGARTVYDSITANFVINDGVLANDDLTLDAPWGGVRGAGDVNLGAQTLDYRLTPGLLRDEEGAAGIEVPVLIEGPWTGPSFRPDLEALAEQNLSDAREQIEDGLRDRANDILGTDIEAGDGREEIGEAVQDRIAEETQNVLSRLLGGSDEETDE